MGDSGAPGAGGREAADRLFVGLALTESLRDALHAHLRAARDDRPLPGRPVPPHNWHLTLRFLGGTGREQHERLRERLRAARLGPAFTLGLHGWGAFPRATRASVLWLGVEHGADAAARLAAAVESTARLAGFAADARPFRAHLTLSRLQPPRDLRPVLLDLPPFREPMAVTDVVLFRSQLGSGPARYEVIERFPLVPAGPVSG